MRICSQMELEGKFLKNFNLKSEYKEIPNMLYSVEDWSKINKGNNGFVNDNNTCFISSALQCILRIQPLSDYFSN